MSRIRIDDLPVTENLTPEQEALIEGAGLKSFRPTLENLETRDLMSTLGGTNTFVFNNPGTQGSNNAPPPIQRNNTFEFNTGQQGSTNAGTSNAAGNTSGQVRLSVADANKVLGYVNEERAKLNLPPLVADPALTSAAEKYATFSAQHHTNLVKNQGLSDSAARAQTLVATHDLDGKTQVQRARDAGFPHDNVGEVAHAGPQINAEQAVRLPGYGWMSSPGHRAAILSENYNYTLAGVGVAYSASGVPYYVMKLASPRS